MHYYQFNIGDYKAHTAHLEPLEDIAYRRILDWMYLHEKPLPESIDAIARAIGMRTHSDCIAAVLQEFFLLDNGYTHPRVNREIQAFHDKKEKAKQSANARWTKENTGAMRTHTERNAKHKPLTINQEPLKETAVVARGDAKPCPHQEIINLYHEHLHMCPAIKLWTNKRQELLRQRWKESEERQSLEWWARFFTFISKSSFLTGRVQTHGDRKPFVVDLEWIIRPSNFVKIIEGRYEDE